MTGGIWKIHCCGEDAIVMDEGIDTVLLSSSEQGAVINCNGNNFIKSPDGINMVVYDKCIGSIVDHVAVTDVNEFNFIR